MSELLVMDTWPPLPIIIRYSPFDAGEEGERNMIAALGLREAVLVLRR